MKKSILPISLLIVTAVIAVSKNYANCMIFRNTSATSDKKLVNSLNKVNNKISHRALDINTVKLTKKELLSAREWGVSLNKAKHLKLLIQEGAIKNQN